MKKQWVGNKRRIRPIVREQWTEDIQARKLLVAHKAGIIPGPSLYGN